MLSNPRTLLVVSGSLSPYILHARVAVSTPENKPNRARRGRHVRNRSLGWTLAGLALALSFSAGLACDQQAKNTEGKDTPVAAAKLEGAGCDMPCCAHAKAADDEKVAAVAPPADKPCAGHGSKGCPKRAAATAAAKAEPAKDVAETDTPSSPGTNR